jgi:hypothetical protein
VTKISPSWYMDADFDLDALLASFSGEPAAVSDLIVPSPPPARDAEAGLPESVTSRQGTPVEEALSEIERFLMTEGDAEGDGAVEDISVDEFFDALYDGGDGDGEEKEKGKGSEAGGSTDEGSGREEEVVTPEADKVEVDGDDPVSKKKMRCAGFNICSSRIMLMF